MCQAHKSLGEYNAIEPNEFRYQDPRSDKKQLGVRRRQTKGRPMAPEAASQQTPQSEAMRHNRLL